MLTSFFRAGETPSESHLCQQLAKVGPPFCPTQTEDTIVLVLREQWKWFSALMPSSFHFW